VISCVSCKVQQTTWSFDRGHDLVPPLMTSSSVYWQWLSWSRVFYHCLPARWEGAVEVKGDGKGGGDVRHTLFFFLSLLHGGGLCGLV
jgi:hypothetical protein